MLIIMLKLEKQVPRIDHTIYHGIPGNVLETSAEKSLKIYFTPYQLHKELNFQKSRQPIGCLYH